MVAFELQTSVIHQFKLQSIIHHPAHCKKKINNLVNISQQKWYKMHFTCGYLNIQLIPNRLVTDQLSMVTGGER